MEKKEVQKLLQKFKMYEQHFIYSTWVKTMNQLKFFPEGKQMSLTEPAVYAQFLDTYQAFETAERKKWYEKYPDQRLPDNYIGKQFIESHPLSIENYNEIVKAEAKASKKEFEELLKWFQDPLNKYTPLYREFIFLGKISELFPMIASEQVKSEFIKQIKLAKEDHSLIDEVIQFTTPFVNQATNVNEAVNFVISPDEKGNRTRLIYKIYKNEDRELLQNYGFTNSRSPLGKAIEIIGRQYLRPMLLRRAPPNKWELYHDHAKEMIVLELFKQLRKLQEEELNLHKQVKNMDDVANFYKKAIKLINRAQNINRTGNVRPEDPDFGAIGGHRKLLKRHSADAVLSTAFAAAKRAINKERGFEPGFIVTADYFKRPFTEAEQNGGVKDEYVFNNTDHAEEFIKVIGLIKKIPHDYSSQEQPVTRMGRPEYYARSFTGWFRRMGVNLAKFLGYTIAFPYTIYNFIDEQQQEYDNLKAGVAPLQPIKAIPKTTTELIDNLKSNQRTLAQRFASMRITVAKQLKPITDFYNRGTGPWSTLKRGVMVITSPITVPIAAVGAAVGASLYYGAKYLFKSERHYWQKHEASFWKDMCGSVDLNKPEYASSKAQAAQIEAAKNIIKHYLKQNEGKVKYHGLGNMLGRGLGVFTEECLNWVDTNPVHGGVALGVYPLTAIALSAYGATHLGVAIPKIAHSIASAYTPGVFDTANEMFVGFDV